MHNTYDHTLRTNPRYIAAANTNQRSGGAFEGGEAFRERPHHSALWWLVAAAALAGFAYALMWI